VQCSTVQMTRQRLGTLEGTGAEKGTDTTRHDTTHNMTRLARMWKVDGQKESFITYPARLEGKDTYYEIKYRLPDAVCFHASGTLSSGSAIHSRQTDKLMGDWRWPWLQARLSCVTIV